MKYGFFTDRGLDKQNLIGDPWNKLEWHPDINSYGYSVSMTGQEIQ